MLPQAYVSPAAMRATRDLLRRRMSRTRNRAELLAHIQHTNRQDNLPEMGTTLADTATHDGVAERFPAPAAPKSLEVDLALLGDDAPRRSDREVHLVNAAPPHDANPRYLLQTGPGIGTILSLVRRSEIHDIPCGPSVQDFVSAGRLVQGVKESAGIRDGTAGTKMGHASLKGACSEAAVLWLRDNPAGQTYLTRLANTHGQGHALTVLAQKWGRAVDDM